LKTYNHHILQTDYLIVGQGLAGTLLAYFLEKAGQSVLVIDQAAPNAASRVAAGLINPITGRRYVKSWLIDQLLPFAKRTYQQLEADLDISFYFERNILRTLFNSREENDWLLRIGSPGYEPYMLDEVDLGSYAEHIKPAFSYGEVTHTAQVQLSSLVEAYQKDLIKKQAYIREDFQYDLLVHKPDGVHYREHQAKGVIFCEGNFATTNPFFNYLPFQGAKGEVLIIKIPNIRFEKIIKRRIFLTPLSDGTYWVGSAYNWDLKEEGPTEEGKQYLVDRLNDFLTVPFEVIRHQAAIRPAVKDRRPFLGAHPKFSNCFIFNGLGTKGASLGPFWAKTMSDFLSNHTPLPAEVDIRRFYQ